MTLEGELLKMYRHRKALRDSRCLCITLDNSRVKINFPDAVSVRFKMWVYSASSFHISCFSSFSTFSVGVVPDMFTLYEDLLGFRFCLQISRACGTSYRSSVLHHVLSVYQPYKACDWLRLWILTFSMLHVNIENAKIMLEAFSVSLISKYKCINREIC